MLRIVEGIPKSETIERYEVIGSNIKVFYQDGGSNYFPLRSISRIEDIQEMQAGMYVESNIWKLSKEEFLEKDKNEIKKARNKVNRNLIVAGVAGGVIYLAAASFDQSSVLSKLSMGFTMLTFATSLVQSGIRGNRIEEIEKKQEEVEYIAKYDLYLRNIEYFRNVLPRYQYRDVAISGEEPEELITINNLDDHSLEDVRNSLSIVARCGTTEERVNIKQLPDPRDRSRR